MRAWWRWCGCGGSVLLAASAFLAGALRSGDPGAGLRTDGFGAVPASFTVGLVCWLAGIILLITAWLRAPEVDVRTGLLWALPLLVAPPLGSRDIYAYACQGWLWSHGVDPYSSGVAQGGCPWAESVPELWWQTPTPYGPVGVALSGLAAATGTQVAAIVALRVIALLAAVVLAWQLPRLAVLCGVGQEWALRLGVITPLVLIHGLSGGHNDIVVAALVVSALATAAAQRSPVVAGLLLAAAVAVKVTAIVALPFVLILVVRKGIALASAVAGFGLFSVFTGLGLGWAAALRGTGELAQWSSVPSAVGMAAGYVLRPFGIEADGPIAVARVAGVIVLGIAAILLLRKAWRQRADIRAVILACGLLMAATALLGPVFYPWYAIGPLAVLAAAGARRWMRTATVVCTVLTLPNGLGIPVLSKAVGAFAVTAALVWLVLAALRKRRLAPAA